MKATLRCHVHVSRSVHRGIAPTSTTLGLIIPVLLWALCGRMIITRVPDIFCPRRCSLGLRLQWRSTWCVPHFALHLTVWLYICGAPNQTTFLNRERDEAWHELNDIGPYEGHSESF